MAHQSKKLLIDGVAIASGAQGTSAAITFGENVNVHGLRARVQAVHYSTGTVQELNIALLCLPELISVIPTISDANLATDQMQQVTWVLEKCLVLNGELTNCDFAPHSSRTCPPGSRMILVVRNEAALLGNASDIQVSILLQWWETQV